MRRKIIPTLFCVLFAALLTVPTIAYLVFGENTENVLDEKRELAAWPERLSNDYFQRVETWYNDNTPYRMSLITFQKDKKQAYSAVYRDKLHPLISEWFTPAWYTDPDYQERVPGRMPYFAPIEDEKSVYGRNGWLFYTNEHNIDYFRANNPLSAEDMQQWKEWYQELDAICEARGIQLAVMLAPNKEQVYGEYVPSYYIEPKGKRAQVFCDYMKDSGVVYQYPLQTLLSEKANYPVYYQQDTHWNALGAYLSVVEMYKALELPYTPLSQVEIVEKEKVGGDLSNFCGYATKYTDYEVNYKPDVQVSCTGILNGKVEFFTSSAPTEKKIVVVSDSFRTAAKEFLAKDFAKATVLHTDQIEEEEVVKALSELGDGDVLFLMRGERYDAPLARAAARLADVMKN